MIRADEEIAPRLGAHEVLVFVEQILLGHAVAVLAQAHDLLVGHVGVILGEGQAALPVLFQLGKGMVVLGLLGLAGSLQLPQGGQLLFGEVHVVVIHCLFPALFAPAKFFQRGVLVRRKPLHERIAVALRPGAMLSEAPSPGFVGFPQ